jgi:hypothetical protein
MQNRKPVNTALKWLIGVGFVMLICGGCFASLAEGFGDPPPPIRESIRTKWIGGSVLIFGAVLAIGSAISLYITENRRRK